MKDEGGANIILLFHWHLITVSFIRQFNMEGTYSIVIVQLLDLKINIQTPFLIYQIIQRAHPYLLAKRLSNEERKATLLSESQSMMHQLKSLHITSASICQNWQQIL